MNQLALNTSNTCAGLMGFFVLAVMETNRHWGWAAGESRVDYAAIRAQ